MSTTKPNPEPKTSKAASPAGAEPAPGPGEPAKPGKPAAKPAANPAVQLAILIVTLIVFTNAAFYFLSDLYYDDRVKRFAAVGLEGLSRSRADFAWFSVVLGIGSFLAGVFPRHVAHALGALTGVAAAFAAVGALDSDQPFVLAVTLLLVATIFELLIWRSLQLKSRAAWSFLVSLCLVLGIVTLFAAPKLRGLFGIGLWRVLIVPGLLGVATAAFAMIRADYREPAEPR